MLNHPWDEINLIMVYDLFEMLLNCLSIFYGGLLRLKEKWANEEVQMTKKHMKNAQHPWS
jgi:hypothetical protein